MNKAPFHAFYDAYSFFWKSLNMDSPNENFERDGPNEESLKDSSTAHETGDIDPIKATRLNELDEYDYTVITMKDVALDGIESDILWKDSSKYEEVDVHAYTLAISSLGKFCSKVRNSNFNI